MPSRCHSRARTLLLVAALLAYGLPPLPAGASDGAQLVVLVRHAEKATAPADDVALSEAGHARARALAETLSDTRLDAIVTTQFRRTKQTAAPLGDALGLAPIVVPAGDDTAAHAAAVADAVRRAGAAVLVVGHSNTVPAIIEALGGPALDEICETEYANLFVLTRVPGQPSRLTRARYGAPDPPSAPDCGRRMKQ